MDEEESSFEFKLENGKIYKVIAPETHGKDGAILATEWLLASLRRNFFSYMTEYELVLPMPEDFFIGDSYYMVREVKE